MSIRKTSTQAKKEPTMPTTATKTKPKSRVSAPSEAAAMLRADHKHVAELFKQFEKSRSSARKEKLVAEICTELTVHAQIEEEIFYPAVKKALKDKELVPEATVEHATLKDLIAQLEGAPADGKMYDAKVKVLSEYVKHHVKEEENEMFPKARKTSIDMKEMGAKLAARKQELLAESD